MKFPTIAKLLNVPTEIVYQMELDSQRKSVKISSMKSLERRENRPFSGRGSGGKLKRVPIMDLSITGEGPRKDPAVPVDPQRLLEEIRSIRVGGQLARTVSMLRAERIGDRARFRR